MFKGFPSLSPSLVKAFIRSRKIPALSAPLLSSIETTTGQSDSMSAKSGTSHEAVTSSLVARCLTHTLFSDATGCKVAFTGSLGQFHCRIVS